MSYVCTYMAKGHWSHETRVAYTTVTCILYSRKLCKILHTACLLMVCFNSYRIAIVRSHMTWLHYLCIKPCALCMIKLGFGNCESLTKDTEYKCIHLIGIVSQCFPVLLELKDATCLSDCHHNPHKEDEIQYQLGKGGTQYRCWHTIPCHLGDGRRTCQYYINNCSAETFRHVLIFLHNFKNIDLCKNEA